MESSRFCRCSSYCSADPERGDGQVGDSLERLQCGFGKFLAKADDLKGPYQRPFPQQRKVSDGTDGAHHVDVGVVFACQLAG